MTVSALGLIAPFFAMRVLGHAPSESLEEAIARTIQVMGKGPKRKAVENLFALTKTLPIAKQLLRFRSQEKTKIRVCRNCGFVGPDTVYTCDQLMGLYSDYRSDSYNHDRCSVEPNYQAIQHLVGKSKEELTCRLDNIDQLIDRHVKVNSIATVLDWGGGEGKFIPTRFVNKRVTILDVSSEPLANQNFIRVNALSKEDRFDYLQFCHVLEHVSEPHAFVQNALTHLNKNGVIYIEVPQDRADHEIAEFLNESSGARHVLHEHINLYSIRAVEQLGNALGVRRLHVGLSEFNFGWAKERIISGLFVKPS